MNVASTPSVAALAVGDVSAPGPAPRSAPPCDGATSAVSVARVLPADALHERGTAGQPRLLAPGPLRRRRHEGEEAGAERQAKEKNAEIAKLAADAEKAAAEIAKNAWQLPIAAGVYRLTGRVRRVQRAVVALPHRPRLRRPRGHPANAVANGVVTETG